MKPRLLILNPTCLDVVDDHRRWIEEAGVELLADQSNRHLNAGAALALLKEADGVILPAAARTLPQPQDMLACPHLLVCSIAASGYEWLDVAAATRAGIVVAFAPGHEGAEVVADMAWGLMLAVARQIPHHHQLICAGDHTRGMGFSVFGKTLGIIGLGNIGRAVARRAKGFDMKVVATEVRPDEQFVRDHKIELLPLEDLLRRSDFVSLHLRLDETTQHIIGRQQLGLMKPTAVLINTARRELVDEAALAEAIISARLAGAGLDDPPGALGKRLLGLPNVVFTPHLGNRAIEGVNGVFRMAVQNCLNVFRGERPQSVVNAEVYEGAIRRPRWKQTSAMNS